VAICVGYTAVVIYSAVVQQVFGAINGLAALLYIVLGILVFAWTTAWVVSWLEVAHPRHPRKTSQRKLG
jgi:hypothetical protein